MRTLLNDPYGAVIETASDGIGLIVEADARIEATFERLRQPIDKEAITKAAREAFFQENVWQRQMAAEAARDAARKEWWRQVGITVGVAALAVAFTVLCMTLRHDRQMAELEDAQSAVAHEAFADGPTAANNWTLLMAYNHVRDVLGACKQVVVDGRRACDTRIWLDSPARAESR